MNDLNSFENHRRRLTGLAYRFLGSRAEAEDVVQDAFLRWHGADRDTVQDGADKIQRFFAGIARKGPLPAGIRAEPAIINGLPGFLIDEPDGLRSTMAFEVAEGRIAAIYIVRNPDKLKHLQTT